MPLLHYKVYSHANILKISNDLKGQQLPEVVWYIWHSQTRCFLLDSKHIPVKKKSCTVANFSPIPTTFNPIPSPLCLFHKILKHDNLCIWEQTKSAGVCKSAVCAHTTCIGRMFQYSEKNTFIHTALVPRTLSFSVVVL